MTATVVVVVVLVIGLLVLAGARLLRRTARSDDGVTSFRRHIDALSPEARREVIDRVRNARESGRGK